MPCPPRTSHGRHAAAGSRSSSSQALIQLPSTRPIPRGAVQVTQAVAARYIVLWRVIRVVDRRALVIDFSATSRAPVLVGRRERALRSLEAQRPKQSRYILLSSRVALAIRAFALMMISDCLLGRHAGSRDDDLRTQQHRHVAKIPVCLAATCF